MIYQTIQRNATVWPTTSTTKFKLARMNLSQPEPENLAQSPPHALTAYIYCFIHRQPHSHTHTPISLQFMAKMAPLLTKLLLMIKVTKVNICTDIHIKRYLYKKNSPWPMPKPVKVLLNWRKGPFYPPNKLFWVFFKKEGKLKWSVLYPSGFKFCICVEDFQSDFDCQIFSCPQGASWNPSLKK